MKRCEYANKCCYGNIYLANTCAYNENLKDKDLCPIHGKSLEEFMDKIIDEINTVEDILNV